MRTFGVEEELLLLDADSLEPRPLGETTVAVHGDTTRSGHQLTTEFKQEQLEVVSPPQHTFAGQLQAIRTGRALAKEAVAPAGGRVAALPIAPGDYNSHRVPGSRNYRIARRFGATATDQLTNGFHIHVEIGSREEGVAALDRIRIWLPLLLALSSNSPFTNGDETGFASYRYQAWSRWPTSGPTEIFGSTTAYAAHRQALLDTKVPLDSGMLYFDARLCEHQPTLEVRVADVCLKAEHAAVIAVLARALVETALRQQHTAPPQVPATILRTWSWQASRYGVEGELTQPRSGTLASASDAIAQLMDEVRPVLAQYDEESEVQAVVADLLHGGSGANIQRRAFARHHSIEDVMRVVLEATHE